ncbi:SAM-dependent methyltransferase [Micromonospora sp. NPDC049559]|uniref:SAM-dependent methyltransferase n=1 Tax=Micromonospora sp. NPDC049559 TaxID=3155923 RepID=UPI00341A1691
MTAPNDGTLPSLPPDVPTSARMYDYSLGGKDNFPVDRAAVLWVNERYPSGLDATRENRRFLYRVVRYLARDAGIRQFLDLGSGLPTQNNVHQVAQEFRPGARVVYVDVDPIVLTHGRALLTDDESTTFIGADVTDFEAILAHPDTRRLIDLAEPVGVLFLSVGHSIVDDAKLRKLVSAVHDAVAPGSYLAFSQMVGANRELAESTTEEINRDLGMPWKNRTPEDVQELLRGFEPVEPGLTDVKRWHPDPAQPLLAPVDEPLRRFLGAGADETRFMEFGGLLRRP